MADGHAGLKWPRPAGNNVPSFMISGVPYTSTGDHTADPADETDMHTINFEYAYSEIRVKNISAAGGPDMRVGFSPEGLIDTNYYLLAPGEELRARVRGKRLCVRADNYLGGETVYYTIFVSLTDILAKDFPALTHGLYTGI